MRFAGELTLDFCEIETKDASREDVERAARTEPRDEETWYMTLTRSEDEWMDATLHGPAIFGVRCGEAGGSVLECTGLDARQLEAAFVSFYEGNHAWKTLCEWKPRREEKGSSLRKLFS
jgi:hypothetical protein